MTATALSTFVADAAELEVLRSALPDLRPGWVEWLDELPAVPGGEGLVDVPSAGELWPCPLCHAVPGDPCVGTLQDTGRLHVGRGFQIGMTHPGLDGFTGDEVEVDIDECTPTVESGPGDSWRGRCLACGFRTRIVASGNEAVELIHDHTHVGWRDVPVVPRWPQGTDATPKRTEKLREEWMAEHGDLFPVGWFENGGPIRTEREPGSDRHVSGRAPFGGYDIGVVVEPAPSTDLEPVDQADQSPADGDLWSSMEHWLFHEDGDLTSEQAHAVTAKARAYSAELYRILGRAHERRIWVALGHESWTTYVAEEFDISRSRAYQLVARYEANTSLDATSAAYVDGDLDEMTEAQCRPLGTLRNDPVAVRRIWERAKQMSGGLPPTMDTMARAVVEYRETAGIVSPTADRPGPVDQDVDEVDELPNDDGDDDWEYPGPDGTPPADDDDDEVLRGELVDRDTGSPVEPAAPPGAGSSGDGGEGSVSGESWSSPSPSRIKPADVAKLANDQGVAEVAGAVSSAVDVGLRSKLVEDLDLAAQWLRATASHIESRKADLQRSETLRSV